MMIRSPVVVSAALLAAGCASPSTSPVLAELGPTSPAPVHRASDSVSPRELLDAGALATEPAAALYGPLPTPLAPPPPAALFGGDRNHYLVLKGGYLSADNEDLDDGAILELAWGRYFTRLFAVELTAGYFELDGKSAGIENELSGIPLMVAARLSLPIWFFEGYGGLGIGTIYYDGDVATVSDSGFALAGDAFLGADIALLDRLTLGIEAKYYTTDDIDELGGSLDMYTLMLTLGTRY